MLILDMCVRARLRVLLKECTLYYAPMSVCVLTRGCVCFEGVCSLQLYVCVCVCVCVCVRARACVCVQGPQSNF